MSKTELFFAVVICAGIAFYGMYTFAMNVRIPV